MRIIFYFAQENSSSPKERKSMSFEKLMRLQDLHLMVRTGKSFSYQNVYTHSFIFICNVIVSAHFTLASNQPSKSALILRVSEDEEEQDKENQARVN